MGIKCECKREFIFSFIRSGAQAKRGVEFRHAMPLVFGGNWGT